LMIANLLFWVGVEETMNRPGYSGGRFV
jgi:hypothetical protein